MADGDRTGSPAGISRGFARSLADAAAGADRTAVAAGVVVGLAAADGWTVPSWLRAGSVDPCSAVAAQAATFEASAMGPAAGPWAVGALYEATLAAVDRDAGSHYTPPDVARSLVDLVVPDLVRRAHADRTGGGVEPEAPGRPGPRCWDPACGGGAFPLATADALLAAGLDPAVIIGELLWGTDLDPGAILVAEAALVWWASLHGVDVAADVGPGSHLTVGDGLLPRRLDPPGGPWSLADGPGFDLVVGNPPFQGQLAGTSVRSARRTAALRRRWGDDVVRPYTDTASLFLVSGARALAPDGRLLMVQPTSVLSARDAAAARRAAEDIAPLAGLWVAAEPVFGAAVQVCAVVLHRPAAEADPVADGVDAERDRSPVRSDAAVAAVPELDRADRGRDVSPVRASVVATDLVVDRAAGGRDRAPVRRWVGRAVRPLADSAPAPGPATRPGGSRPSGEGGPITLAGSHASWAAYALAALGVPDPVARWSGRVGDLAEARAGFREEYYGLVGHVREQHDPGSGRTVRDDAGPEADARLVTSGLIDPGRCAWGERPALFARQRYLRPVVDRVSLAEAGGRAASWVGALSVPKVVVATQTRVGEAAVDEHGTWVASTPSVALVLRPSAPPDPSTAATEDRIERLWRLAAAVCSPVGSVAALAATAGAARSGDAIRQSVGSVGDLPLPVDDDAWTAGAAALRAQDRSAFLEAMAAAYAVVQPAELHAWWSARAPWPASTVVPEVP